MRAGDVGTGEGLKVIAALIKFDRSTCEEGVPAGA
jgi:hypothetical protein